MKITPWFIIGVEGFAGVVVRVRRQKVMKHSGGKSDEKKKESEE